jgi:hypothetical protein
VASFILELSLGKYGNKKLTSTKIKLTTDERTRPVPPLLAGSPIATYRFSTPYGCDNDGLPSPRRHCICYPVVPGFLLCVVVQDTWIHRCVTLVRVGVERERGEIIQDNVPLINR